MHPLELMTKVNFNMVINEKDSVMVAGEIRGRTIEEFPRYDIMLQDGSIVQNVFCHVVTPIENKICSESSVITNKSTDAVVRKTKKAKNKIVH